MVAYFSYVTGEPVKSILYSDAGTGLDQLGLSNVKMLFTGLFTLLSILMFLMAMKYREHKLSRRNSRFLLALPICIIACLAFVNICLLPQELTDRAF